MTINHQSIYDSIIENGYHNRNATYIFEIRHNNQKCRRYYHHAKSLFNRIYLLEVEALSSLKKQNRILDIGAGAGRLSMYLQIKGYDVTALEKSNSIYKILKKRGVKKVVNADVFEYVPERKYDVALFAGTYSIFGKKKENISKFFDYTKEKILNKKGKFVFILSDTESGKTEVFKRRFIFDKKIGNWLASVNPSLKDVVQLAKINNLSIQKVKKDDDLRYYLILKKNLKSC